jgi:hypothetical protein
MRMGSRETAIPVAGRMMCLILPAPEAGNSRSLTAKMMMMVPQTVAPHRRQDTQGKGENNRQEKPRGCQPEGHGHPFQNQAQGRLLGDEGLAEISPDHPGEEPDVTDGERAVEAHRLPQGLHFCLGGFRGKQNGNRVSEYVEEGEGD